jgi:hypothetical protein
MLAKHLLKANPALKAGLLRQTATRPYFSLMDRVKDKIQQPYKHVKSFFEPDGQNYESQLPDGYRLHGNSA